MNKIYVEERYITECIQDFLSDLRLGQFSVDDAIYHHNSSYKNAPSIIKNGILSYDDMNKLGIIKMTKEQLYIIDDITSHVNGKDGISLSVTGLTDLYRDEYEYDPTNECCIDFLISSDIKASRNSEHYGNEFICYEKILQDKIKSVDVRILKNLNTLHLNSIYKNLNDLVYNFNKLNEIALALHESNENIPLREMSYSDNLLDINKAMNLPSIVLKK